jgi:hypothetical protein
VCNAKWHPERSNNHLLKRGAVEKRRCWCKPTPPGHTCHQRWGTSRHQRKHSPCSNATHHSICRCFYLHAHRTHASVATTTKLIRKGLPPKRERGGSSTTWLGPYAKLWAAPILVWHLHPMYDWNEYISLLSLLHPRAMVRAWVRACVRAYVNGRIDSTSCRRG